MSIRVSHTLDGLADDLEEQPVSEARLTQKLVWDNARRGNQVASEFARQSAGEHGIHYHNAFRAEMLSPRSAEYGPEANRPQGGMSFEFGSRKQPPHLDLAKSTDVVRELMTRDISQMLDRLYW